MKSRSKRPGKDPDALHRARRLIGSSRYRDTTHSSTRKAERKIILPEILDVIRTGFHEAKKDEFKPEFQAWNYAIRGRTVDGRALRIAVAFDDDEDLLILVTVIDLDC